MTDGQRLDLEFPHLDLALQHVSRTCYPSHGDDGGWGGEEMAMDSTQQWPQASKHLVKGGFWSRPQVGRGSTDRLTMRASKHEVMLRVSCSAREESEGSRVGFLSHMREVAMQAVPIEQPCINVLGAKAEPLGRCGKLDNDNSQLFSFWLCGKGFLGGVVLMASVEQLSCRGGGATAPGGKLSNDNPQYLCSGNTRGVRQM
ncbi:hypothetical protein OsI_19359 [Oryza sativa Indica Group]|uniref:Uncharacterized protein n=2 Tax=Oryza sativa TaxID=4530 RepID=B9FK48_ORYSJ|nr:hypothetical protein OsI_19359 [Oryza sativa Indica Group]EEE63146.1 hypothetical protein OsJ_17954 [Oryza sativa Japonica Group]